MLSTKFKYSYLINLKRREDRYENFLKNFKYGNEVTRFNAVDAKNFDYGDPVFIDNLKSGLKNVNKVVKPGVLACTLSHFKVWETIANNENINDDELCLIFEDDVMFHENFDEIFDEDFQGVDLIYFGGKKAVKQFIIEKEMLEKYWKPSSNSKYLYERKVFDLKVIDIFCTIEAYAMNKRTAKIITERYRNELILKHTDHIIEDIKSKKSSDIADKIRMFNYFPIVCFQAEEMGTDIWTIGLTKSQLFLKKFRKLIPLPPIKTLLSLKIYISGYLKFKFGLQK
jgi:GR25 family glycosyltransferase involved in LPS biosynthesis